MNPNTSTNNAPHAGLIRRLLAISYDAFLLIAIFFVTTFIANTLNNGNAISSEHPLYYAYVLMLLTISFTYFGWFWTHGGQTLGMKTWKLQLVSYDNNSLNWKQAFLHFIAAIISWLFAGAGFIWIVLQSENRSFHDLISNSVLLDIKNS